MRTDATDLEFAIHDAQRRADTAKITQEFVAGVEKNGLLYQLQWATDVAKRLAEAEYWGHVLRISEREDETFLSALNIMIEETSRELLEDMLRGGSSSEFSNACEHAKRAGASRFVREATGWVKTLTH